MSHPLRIGVIGLGFMGATHVAAILSAAAAGVPCVLAAVADRNASRRAGQKSAGGNLETGAADRMFDPSAVRAYETPEQLLADSSVDAVCICTRTDTHVQLATAAIKAGKHVLIEKPVSLSAHEIDSLADLAAASSRVAMPAMCIRFWPAWSYLADAYQSGKFGLLKSLLIERAGGIPGWNAFYATGSASGGAIFDLHVHDTDFVYHLFGKPSAVFSRGSGGASGAIDQLSTQYMFSSPNSPALVSAVGLWSPHDSFAFRMRYVAVFEQATMDFDISRPAPTPQLLICKNGGSAPADLPAGQEGLTGYDLQLRHFVLAALGKEKLSATLQEAALITRIIQAEQKSIQSGSVVSV